MNAENLNDKIKLHEAAVSMFHDRAAMDESGRENRAPNYLMRDEMESNNERRGHRIQAIPLLSANSRGETLSSFDPSTENGVSTSECKFSYLFIYYLRKLIGKFLAMENVHQQQRQSIPRRHSVSSNSSTSTSRSRIPKLMTKSKYGSVTHIPSTPGVHLTPDAERRIFDYNYRGPVPLKHRCQRSLFGTTVEVETTETPKKKRSISQTRTPLRTQSRERDNLTWSMPKYNIRPGMSLHEGSCTAAQKVQSSKSDHAIASKEAVTPSKSGGSKLQRSSAQRRLDAWRPLELTKPERPGVESLTSSTPPFKNTEEDSDGYAIPSISGSTNDQGNYPRNESPVPREVTPPDLYKTPATYFNHRGLLLFSAH